MENLNELKKRWASCAQAAQTEVQLNAQSLNEIVNVHIKKERSLLLNYVIKTSVWIFLITAAFGHLLVRFWGDWNLMVFSFLGLILYIPFTAVFMQRFKSFFDLEKNANADNVRSIYQRLQQKQHEITRFYRFKIYFDLLMIPITCLWMVLIINAFSFSEGPEVHWVFNSVVLVLSLTLFVAVTMLDNERYFKKPLRQIVRILNDMES